MSLKTLGIEEHNQPRWAVLFHDEFFPEFRIFPESARRETYLLIELLKVLGPQLGRPHADTLTGSKLTNLKELRFAAEGGVWRIAFAFDAKRRAILLVGGNKSGTSQSRFYRNLIAVSERRFAQHQEDLAAGKE